MFKYGEFNLDDLKDSSPIDLYRILIKNEKTAIQKYNNYQSKNRIKDEKINYIEKRNIAREKLQGICAVNKVCDGDPERFCIGQSYGAHIGLGGVGKGLGQVIICLLK